MQTGAFKLTTKSGDFIHVVCARWNKSIDHQREPYDVIQSEIDKHVSTATVCCIPCRLQ